jgi:hypothetical protein
MVLFSGENFPDYNKPLAMAVPRFPPPIMVIFFILLLL